MLRAESRHFYAVTGKILRWAALLVAGSSILRAQAADIPHAFPRDGAARVLDNAWGTVWDVKWAPHKAAPLHTHRYDYVGVELVKATVNFTSPGGFPRTVELGMGEAYFRPRGETHVEEPVTAEPARHTIVIDLKDAPTRKYANTTRYSVAAPGGVAIKLAENARVAIWEYQWTPGRSSSTRFLERDAFMVVVEGGELRATLPNGQVEIRGLVPGQVLFRPGGRAQSEQTTGSLRAIIIELK